MTIKQKNAIYYAKRERKLKQLEKLGLLEEFYQFNQGKKYICIQSFINHKIVQALFTPGGTDIVNDLMNI